MHYQKHFMEAWSNIEVPANDPEIIQINQMEEKLGKLPEKVGKIRELITRFEVCHFKFQHHINRIKDSIINLEPATDPLEIGLSHIRQGEDAWKKDKTGRSKTGQQYLGAIKEWLYHDPQIEDHAHNNEMPDENINLWLGDKNPDKTRLVRLLLARLTWDWKAYKEMQHGGELKELEQQICRMDICHYAFPENLDLVIQAIGELKPVTNFEGCGSFNATIQAFVEKELSSLRDMLQSLTDSGKSDRDELIKAWLLACLIKTMKEQVGL